MVLAQVLAGASFVNMAIWIILIAAVVAIVFVILRQMGVSIPPFVVTVLWIIFAAVIGVMAIIFLARMVGGA